MFIDDELTPVRGTVGGGEGGGVTRHASMQVQERNLEVALGVGVLNRWQVRARVDSLVLV